MIFYQNLKTILGHEKEIKTYFSTLSNQALIETMMSGIRKEDIQLETTHLVEYLDDRYPFYLDPMPNLYFTRDHKRVLVEVCRSSYVLARKTS